MAVVIGTNSGFVTTAPTADPAASATVIDNLAMAISDVTPALTGSVSEIGWFCANATQETNFEVGIYEDNGADLPGDLISSYTTNAKGTGSGWKRVTVDITLSENTKYWIAVQVDNTATTTFVDFTALAQKRSIDNSSTQLVDPWVNEGVSTTNAMAIYAVVETLNIAQSTSIEFNNGLITTAKLTATFTGNTPTFSMTADGTNFEDVTSGTAHNFSTTGTDLRWKAQGSGTTITELKIEDFRI